MELEAFKDKRAAIAKGQKEVAGIEQATKQKLDEQVVLYRTRATAHVWLTGRLLNIQCSKSSSQNGRRCFELLELRSHEWCSVYRQTKTRSKPNRLRIERRSVEELN